MLHKQLKIAMAIACISGMSALTGCKKETGFIENSEEKNITLSPKKTEKDIIFYALTEDQKLVKYSTDKSKSEMGSAAITGLKMNESIRAIDFRPATGQLYGISNQSRIYVINYVTGVANAVSETPFPQSVANLEIGFDFNPMVDRIRLVLSDGRVYRLNPETGGIAATDPNINLPEPNKYPAVPKVTAVAYTNNFAGTSSTTLYDIDAANDKLFVQDPPNQSTLVEVGPLKLDASLEGGFDISPDNSFAIAALNSKNTDKDDDDDDEMEDDDTDDKSKGKYWFYNIDLKTGKAKKAGKSDKVIIGLAIPTNPVAYAVDDMNNLLIFNPEVQGGVIQKPLTGLLSGEKIVGADMRPATAQLYVLGSSSHIYAVNMSNGVAALIDNAGPLPFTLQGTSFGFDFNPTVDLIRIVSNTGQNLRVNPNNGALASNDPELNPAPGTTPNPASPMVDGAGYTNSFAKASTTMLFDIDFGSDMLVQQNPANAGTLTPIGPLGINVTEGNGFDIGGMSNKASGIFTVDGVTGLYQVNLANGKATKVYTFSTMVKGYTIGLGF